MALDPGQRRILARIKQIGRQRGASAKEIKSAIETGLVESNLRNLPGGDADSAGWRQERASLYKDPTNLDASINRYFDETAQVKNKYATAGALSAAVQRPAAQFRGRYQQRSAEAQALLGGAAGAGASQGSTTRTVTPGVDNSGARSAAVAQFLNETNADPVQFALRIRSLQDTPGTVEVRNTPVHRSAGVSSVPTGGGVTTFDGKEVASWMVPALSYARKHGWTGTITSGVRTYAQQAALYANRANNPNPVARPGTSNHEVGEGGSGAVDVTDADTLARALRGFRGRTLKQGTAIGDPVHFSASGR